MIMFKILSALHTAVKLPLNLRFLSKRTAPNLLAPLKLQAPKFQAQTRGARMIPLNQYENNYRPKKFQLTHALLHHWETIPLFLVVCFDIFVVLGYSLYVALQHKVDTQFTSHNWNCISRKMDLRHPTIHKNIVLYQRYEPWPEMQDVLDKMQKAEVLAKRSDICNP